MYRPALDDWQQNGYVEVACRLNYQTDEEIMHVYFVLSDLIDRLDALSIDEVGAHNPKNTGYWKEYGYVDPKKHIDKWFAFGPRALFSTWTWHQRLWLRLIVVSYIS